jgi:hypothetical protein
MPIEEVVAANDSSIQTVWNNAKAADLRINLSNKKLTRAGDLLLFGPNLRSRHDIA